MAYALLSARDLAAVCIVSIVVVIALLVKGRKLSVQVGQVQATVNDTAAKVDEAAAKVEQVNAAVNHRSDAAPSLIQMADDIHVGMAELHVVLPAVRAEVSSISRKLDRHLAHHQAQSEAGDK